MKLSSLLRTAQVEATVSSRTHGHPTHERTLHTHPNMHAPCAAQVEATVSKAVLWVIGTAVGGTLGFIVMVDNDLATNPYGLMAILCAFTFVVGSMSGHQVCVCVCVCVPMSSLALSFAHCLRVCVSPYVCVCVCSDHPGAHTECW